MKYLTYVIGLSIIMASCSEKQELINDEIPTQDIGIKNPIEVDSLSDKLKEIEALIEANEKAIEKLDE